MTRILKTFGLILIFTTGQIMFGQTTFNYKDDFKKVLLKTNDPKDQLSYEKLLKRFYVNDTTLTNFEVLALLIGFTNKKEYKPYQDINTEREIYNLNGEKKYQEALDKGIKFIETHPLSVKVLFEIAYSYQKLEKEDSAKFYSYKGQRIFEAMYFSGDGTTIETPAFALGPADGQDFIYKVVGADIGTMGSGRDKNGNFIDILEAKFEDGKTMNLYFIIQHATDKMFDGKSIEEELKQQDKKKKKNQ
jgi:hypothetical protein